MIKLSLTTCHESELLLSLNLPLTILRLVSYFVAEVFDPVSDFISANHLSIKTTDQKRALNYNLSVFILSKVERNKTMESKSKIWITKLSE